MGCCHSLLRSLDGYGPLPSSEPAQVLMRSPAVAVKHIQDIADLHVTDVPIRCKKMLASLHAFFAANPLLFFRDLKTRYVLDATIIPGAPVQLIAFDCHVLNQSTLRLANNDVVWAMDDFDQCVVAPVDYDWCRAVASLAVFARSRITPQLVDVWSLCEAFYTAYVSEANHANADANVWLDPFTAPPFRQLHRKTKHKSTNVDKHCANNMFLPKPNFAAPDSAAHQALIHMLNTIHPGIVVLDVVIRTDMGGSTAGMERIWFLVADPVSRQNTILELKELAPVPLNARIDNTYYSKPLDLHSSIVKNIKAFGFKIDPYMGGCVYKMRPYMLRQRNEHTASLDDDAITWSSEAMQNAASVTGRLLARAHARTCTDKKAFAAWLHSKKTKHVIERLTAFARTYAKQCALDFHAMLQKCEM